MNDQNINTNVNSVIEDSGGQPLSDFNLVTEPPDMGSEALSLDPGALEKPPPDVSSAQGLKSRNPFAKALKLFKRADVWLVILVVGGSTALLIATRAPHNKPTANASVASKYNTQQIPLAGFLLNQQGVSFMPSDVTINGTLKVSDSVIVAPSVQPNAPTAGQLYFDHNTNQLAYYNGTGFVALTQQGAVVQNIGGVSGSITLGGGLSVVNNQLTAAFPPGVSSIGGVNGSLTVGNGLKLVGSDIQNSGVISLAPGTPNLVVGSDGRGNLTISSVGGGSGTVTSGGGTAGRIAKFTGVQNVEDSLLSESGTTVTTNGNLVVTGSLALGTVLSVANGGTGVASLPANSVIVGQGVGPLTGVTAASPGLCLVSTVGAPTFQACSGSTGVSSVNGLTGALTIANATGSVNTITIDDAGTSTKGIASFNGTNFTVTGGAVNTAQNISTSSTPTFVGVNTNNVTPSGALTIGAAAQSLSLLGSASSVFSVTGGGQTTTVGFNGAPTGAVTYNFDRSAAAGTYNICTTAANCSGIGGSVTTPGGTTNRLSKFTGGQTIGDSSISDNGSVVTVNGTANLVVQGGTATLGTLTQAGTLFISDGLSHTVSIVAAGLSADRVYTLPDAGGNATLCVNSGNCIGGTGAAPNAAEYLVANLNGTLTNERALAGGSNISLTDGGPNAAMTVATVQNPSFTTSVTTPVLQSSGALTISSAAGTIVAINAGTTIELQNSTNVTGSLDVSASFTAGTANAFQVNSGGAIAAATGITSSGTITFSGLNCTTFANGGALTTDVSGQLVCSNDDGGSSSAITGSGSSGTVPLFNGAQTITNSIITQSGTTISIAGDLTLTTALSVSNGGTGTNTLNARGLLYGNGTGAVQVTAAGTSGQVLVANGSGIPTFVSFSGDVAVSNTGVTTIQPDSVALGTDTTGGYVANLGALTGLSTSGNSGEGSTPTLSVTYGSIASTAVQGNVTLTCPSGVGNLSGGGNSVTLGAGGSCNNINIVNNPTFTASVTTPSMILTGAGFSGTIQVANLGQGTVYTLPDPGGAAATICISTGNCATAGSAGGDLTGTYPNPTIAKLQGTNLTLAGPAAGHILVYNATNSRWENHAITGAIAISETGVSTVQPNSVALGTDTTGNYVLGLTAGNGVNISGSAGEGWSPTVAVVYGSGANTAVQGNTSITVSAGTNLTGGGSITLGAGGTVTLNVATSPTFSGTLAVQGATATIGTSSQQGSVVLNDGVGKTGTFQTASLGQNTTYTLPDPGGATATICLTTGNCAGTGTGVTTAGGTTNRVSKFTGAQAIGDSTISDNGSVVTINGTANFVVQGGTGTFGTLTQAGTLAVSDGSSNTVSIVAAGLAADRIYTLPDAGANATFCLDTGNCIGSGGGGAPNNATYLLTSLNGTLTNERALANGSNIAFTDAGPNGNFTVATVQNPTFTTSVTTPLLQSSGALTISSAAGTTVAINAGTTIELQSSTNVTGSLDVSASFTSGTANAFQVSAAGAITAATGLTTSGTVTFSGLNCTTFANGGALTTNASGQVMCSDDDGGAAGAINGTGTSGKIPVFTGAQTIANSIVTQASTTITIAGDLVLNTALTVANGGTGAVSLTARGLLYGNGTGAVQVTSPGTGGQVLIADASGVPTFASFTGDVAVSNTGVTTIQPGAVALGTDTTGNYVANLGVLTGLTTSGNTGAGSTPTLSVTYGSGANTAVQGNTSLTCPSGAGNLSGGGNSVTLGTGGSCNAINIVNNPSFTTSVTTPSLILTGAGFSGTIQVANLGQATAYTLPDPGGATATICLTTGNCTAIGAAGGDLTGSYPNPTIAKLQSGTLTISSVASGNLLQYNGSAWVNQSISGDITLNSSAVATIGTGKVNSGNILDNTIVNADLASGSFGNITGVGTLSALTVTGATLLNTTGTANTAIGNATGTFQVASNGLNISTGGALTGVSGITTSGGYTQSGVTANTLSGATSFTAAGTALSVTNNATISGTLTTNTISPNSSLTVGVAGQSFTLQGNGTSTIKSTDTGNTTTLGFVTPTANTNLNLPALAAGTYTICTSSGNCGGVGATLQTAYTNSTNPEIVLDATRGALTVRDTSGGLGANLFEVQNNAGSTTYFNVTASGVNTTGTNVSSGNINTTSGAVQTGSTDRISNGGNLVNIGTITTSGAINAQTISSAANFTGTVTIQGTSALTLGTASTNTGAILLKGSGGAGTLTLSGPTIPNVGNFTLSIPAITANANVCTDNSICTGYAPASGSGSYATRALDNLSAVAINAALGFQANQTANINFAASAATTGNALNITGQTAGATANNGGDVTIQGGTGTTTGAGGTTTVRGGNATATGTNGLLTLDAGSGATVANGTINIGAANASTINVGTNNTLTSTIQIGASAQSAGTQTINIGNSNTAGGTTNVVIGAGTTATGGTTTVRSKGSLSLTGGAASTWDVNGTLSLQTANNGAVTTGSGLWTQGGNLTFNGTAARTITGPATGGLTVTVATGPLALSTTGSGTLSVSSAGALSLSGAAASTLNVGANTFAVTSSNINVTAGGVLTTTSAVLQGTNALTLGTASTNTGAIVLLGSGGAGTLTLAGPTTPNAGNFTLTIPAITANANVCTDNSVCTGYAPASGSGSYANVALSNLSGVAINAALGFQSNQTANINFAATAAAAGNALNITGQTAGATANNGGDITIQGGTGTTTGTGGTTTVRGGNAAATGTNGALTLDAGSGATTANGTVNLGNANANAINIGVNNTLTSTIQIGATAQSANTQTINIGNSNTAGGTTNVVIGSGATAAGGSTTLRAKGVLGLTGGAASTWDVNGTLSLQTTNNAAITTGTGLWTQGGNLTFNGTAARTITGPATGGLTVNTTTGPLTLSTTTSGTLAVTSAGALNLSGAAASTLNVGANTLAVTSSNFNVTAGGALTAVSGSLTGTSALTLGTGSTNTGAILFKGSGGAGTLTLAGPTTPNAGNFTLTIPAIGANANVCTDNSVCAGYQASGSYANTALSNLSAVAINAPLNFVSTGAGSIGFNAAAVAAGNSMTIIGQAATGANAGGLLSLQGGAADGAAAGSVGGAVQIAAQNGSNAGSGGAGGNVTITAGNGQGTGPTNGGTITLQAGSAVGAGTTGGVLVKNAGNSTTAFQVQNTGSSALVTADTTNMRVSVGNIGTPTGQLYVGGQVPTAAIGSVATGTTPYMVVVAGRYAYVANNGTSTLQAYDVSNPASPVSIGTVATGANTRFITVAGRYAYVVNDGAATLQIFDISNPASMSSVGTVATGTNPFHIVVAGRYAYVANNGASTLQAFDISNPASPVSVGTVATGTNPTHLAISGRYAYVTNQTSSTLQAFDISNPASMSSVSTVATNTGPRTVAVSGRYAYVSNQSTSTLQIFDISNPASMSSVGSVATGTNDIGVAVSGRYAYVANNSSNNFQILDVSNPASPSSLGTTTTGSGPRFPVISGRYLYIVNQASATLQIFDMGGAYSQSLEVGTIEAGSLRLSNDVSVGGNLTVTNGLNIAGASLLDGSTAINGSVTAKNKVDSGAAFQVQNAAGNNLLAVDTSGNAVRFGTATAGLGSLFFSTVSGADTAFFMQSGSALSATNIQYAIQKRANNKDLLQYAYDGTTFWNYLQTDWTNKALTLNDTPAGITNIGAVASSTNSTTTHIGDTNNATGTQAITIGSTANTANSTTVQGGSLTFQTSSSTAGALLRTTTNSTAALQVQNSTNDQLFNMTTVAKANTITNPGFETNTTAPWATVNGGTVALSRVTTQSYSQTASMQVAVTSATQWAGAKYATTLTSGQSYSLSFYVKSSSGTALIDAGYSNTGAFAGEIDCVSSYPTIYTTGWTRVSCTFTAGAPSGSPYIYIETPSAATATFWIDNVQLTQTTTDNGALYSGQIDFTGSAISGQAAFQATNDSTGAMQVFSSAGVPVLQVDTINKQTMTTQLLVTDNFSTPTKGWRFRTNGSGLDLETSGGTGPGSLWLTGWSGATGTFGSGSQYTFLRSDPTLNQPVVTLGAGFGSATPTITVLDTKNTAGDPSYGTNGAMYYNSSSNTFRCYQASAWTNCVGVTSSDTARQQPFYSTDFFSIDNTPANAGYSEQQLPWLGSWANAAGNMGVVQSGVANHPGIVRMSSAGVANTGWLFETGVSSILLSGGESFEAVFRTPSTFSNTTIRMGFLDTTTITAPSDGVYVELAPGTTTTSVTGKTANGGTTSSTGTTGTVSVSTFYRVKVTLNSNASTATFTLYIDGTNTVLWTNTLSTNIPTTATHETGSGVIATNSVGAAALLDMDYMAMWLSQAMAR